MEFPNIGQQCSVSSCKQLDFLPMKCDACKQIFCGQHIKYMVHCCPESYLKLFSATKRPTLASDAATKTHSPSYVRPTIWHRGEDWYLKERNLRILQLDREIHGESNVWSAAEGWKKSYRLGAKDNRVPVCPLCQTPCPVPPGASRDIVVGRHIDNDCQSDSAKQRRTIYTNKCSMKSCKHKELVPMFCERCRRNFCIRHRNEMDHACQGLQGSPSPGTVGSQTSRKDTALQALIPANMTEEEAIQQAILESTLASRIPENHRNNEAENRELAQALAAIEEEDRLSRQRRQQAGRGKRCSLS